MKMETIDPCILLKRKDGIHHGLILRVDDSLGICTDYFLNQAETAYKAFRCKPRTELSEHPVSFNDILISKGAGKKVSISQTTNKQLLSM